MNFHRRVAAVCSAIPSGKVATYGQIAMLCGKPRGARAVGWILNRGAAPNAHRVVNRDGFLSGAAAFASPDFQKHLLEAEGISVTPAQTVDLKQFRWNPSQEDAQALALLFREEGL